MCYQFIFPFFKQKSSMRFYIIAFFHFFVRANKIAINIWNLKLKLSPDVIWLFNFSLMVRISLFISFKSSLVLSADSAFYSLSWSTIKQIHRNKRLMFIPRQSKLTKVSKERFSMSQGRFSVPLRGRKCKWYLMKGCIKDFSNLLDSNLEIVPFSIFCVFLFFFKNIADMETRLTLKQMFLFTISINHHILQLRAFLNVFG